MKIVVKKNGNWSNKQFVGGKKGEREREEKKYGLRVVPGKASVNVNRESGG